MGEYILDMLYHEEKQALEKMHEEFDQLQQWRRKETERLGKQLDTMTQQLGQDSRHRRKSERFIWLCHICHAVIFLLCILGSA